MAKKYELVLILDPQSGDTQLETAVESYKSRLESAGAEVANVDKWGLRKLAYTSMALRQRQQAYYVLYQFTGDSELLGPLEAELKLDETVLRHLFVAVSGEFVRVPQLAPENVYHPPDRSRDRRPPRRDRRDDGPPGEGGRRFDGDRRPDGEGAAPAAAPAPAPVAAETPSAPVAAVAEATGEGGDTSGAAEVVAGEDNS